MARFCLFLSLLSALLSGTKSIAPLPLSYQIGPKQSQCFFTDVVESRTTITVDVFVYGKKDLTINAYLDGPLSELNTDVKTLTIKNDRMKSNSNDGDFQSEKYPEGYQILLGQDVDLVGVVEDAEASGGGGSSGEGDKSR